MPYKSLYICLLHLILSYVVHAQSAQFETIQLWQDQVPGFGENFKHQPYQQIDPDRISETSRPTMRVFTARGEVKKQAIVIFPGGGYRILSAIKEGDKVAKHFASLGYTCFVARYRVTRGNNPGYRFPGPLLDARQAIKLAKASAKKYGFDPKQVGVMGFSAGGHLAAMCATLYNQKFDGEVASPHYPRPAFAALIYPVASMIAPSSHRGSKLALLGKNPAMQRVRLTSPELNIKKSGPPIFIAHNEKDPVDAKLSIAFDKALKKNGIHCDLHIFKGGDHGFGMGRPGQTKETNPAIVWPELLIKFLDEHKAIDFSSVPQIPQFKGWKLAWHDEFDGNALNSKFWTRSKRTKSDWANTMSPREDLLEIKAGILTLKGIENKDKSKDKSPFLTAGITSKDKYSFLYGKVQIRAKFKSAQGAWPALWMLGDKGRHPHNGEIDLMEHLNFDNKVYQTIHSHRTVNLDKTNTPKKSVTATINKDDWNTYGCEWDSDKVVFTVNNKVTHTYPRVAKLGPHQWPFKQPFYFILSMQIGGGWVNGSGATNPAHYPANMQVDWVRVYKKN